MVEIKLIRFITDKYGTFGKLIAPELGFSCYTAEPPWKDNIRNLSCIPEGSYDVHIRRSPKYGKIFHVTDVPRRSYILIHSGNYAGDIVKGYKTHTRGCIMLGKTMGILNEQRVVLNSRITIRKFMNLINNEPFKLKILWL